MLGRHSRVYETRCVQKGLHGLESERVCGFCMHDMSAGNRHNDNQKLLGLLSILRQ